MGAYFILLLAIIIQFTAAILALRLVWITKKTFAWTSIAIAIVLMGLRRCFTAYEWYSRGMALLPVDIGQEIVGLATTVFMLVGVALIAPLFAKIKRSEDQLRERVEERTAELNRSYQALQVELTERRQAEREKAKLESQLRQAHKMEAIGTLAGGIAHDFNNILTPIIMFSEIAQRELAEDSPIRPYLDQVLKSSKRASDLVKQILTISRQTERKHVFMELGPLVKESLKLLRASLPATIEIQQDLNPEEGWILADPTEIYQVVMNLCTNAAHAMEETGGVLGVRLKNVNLDQPVSAFGLDLKPGPYLSLAIRDSGHGIPPDIFERIFEPYFTTKGIGEGTGLGLALVHSIARSSGGGIDVVSEPGKGTTIQVFFPLLKNTDQVESEQVMPMPRGSERILLADDEPDIVAAVKIILEKLGYQVETFNNGQEALEAFWADPERFDLVFTDQTMPQLTGMELAQEIIKVRPHLPIVICTGFSEAITPEQVQSQGIVELLLKPLTPDKLADAVRRGLDTRKNLTGLPTESITY